MSDSLTPRTDKARKHCEFWNITDKPLGPLCKTLEQESNMLLEVLREVAKGRILYAESMDFDDGTMQQVTAAIAAAEKARES